MPFAMMLFLLPKVHAQSINTNMEKPNWVVMMEDPQANYFEAVKAFEKFWDGREEPQEEMEIMNEEITGKEKRAHRREERKLRRMSTSERNRYDYLAYQYKRFKNWQHEVLTYVQENGHILTNEEKLAIYQKQQQEMQNRSKN